MNMFFRVRRTIKVYLDESRCQIMIIMMGAPIDSIY